MELTLLYGVCICYLNLLAILTNHSFAKQNSDAAYNIVDTQVNAEPFIIYFLSHTFLVYRNVKFN